MSSPIGYRVRPLPAFKVLALAALLPATIAAGCAGPSSYSQPNWVAGGPPPRSRIDPETVIAKAKESSPPVEDDGRPSQLPPRLAARAIPDDPNQPWSPNYGGPALKPKAPVAAASKPATAQDQGAMQALQQMAARRVSWQSGN